MPGTAHARYTQCDHCGEVDNGVHLTQWTDAQGEAHEVHPAEVDAYLADLREQAAAADRRDGGVEVRGR